VLPENTGKVKIRNPQSRPNESKHGNHVKNRELGSVYVFIFSPFSTMKIFSGTQILFFRAQKGNQNKCLTNKNKCV